MEGWVGLLGWPTADTLPTKWSHVNHRSGENQGKSASQRPTSRTTEPRRHYLMRSTSRSQSRFLRRISDSIRRSISRSRVACRPSNVIVSLTSGTVVSDLPPPVATASTVPTTVEEGDADRCVVFLERDDDGDDVDAVVVWRTRSLFTSVISIAIPAHELCRTSTAAA